MSDSSAEVRELILDFALWLLDGEFGEGREKEIVDKYLAERAIDSAPPM